MILQALAQYYQRLVEEGNPNVALAGFEKKAIPFLIVLNSDGKLIGIDDTRTLEGRKKKARSFIVPKIFQGSRTVNVKANLLWDKASYVFGVGPKTKPERLPQQRRAFKNTILEYFPDKNTSVHAVLKFLEDYSDISKYGEWEEISKTDPYVAFRLNGKKELICNSSDVLNRVENRGNTLTSIKGGCLVTGYYSPLTRLENPLKGLLGSKKAESHLVAFNDESYWSYGKKYGANAPISESASLAYVSALRFLQTSEFQQVIQVGDATTIFWADKKNEMETVFADIFGRGPVQGKSIQDYKQLTSLFRSPESGIRKEINPETRFYVLGLAPNAARIAIRYWYAGTVGDIADNIWQHFDDLEIAKSPHEWRTVSLRNLLRSTALQELDNNVRPNLAGATMKSIITGAPYPQTLLSSVITRIRAEQSRKDRNGRLLPNVTFTRAALLKAFLVRETRLRNFNDNKKEVGMSLDTSITSPGYLLGRLFAVLERAQESANPGINTTIRERFFSVASSTPNAVFPQLIKLKNHHLAKLQNRGQVISMEKQIGEIMGKLEGTTGFPVYLDLREQGRFAIGYYHQRQDFFTRKDNQQQTIQGGK